MLDRTEPRTLTQEDRQAIIGLYGVKSRNLVAYEYGVTNSVIAGIWHRARKAGGLPKQEKAPKVKQTLRGKRAPAFVLPQFRAPLSLAERMEKKARVMARMAAAEARLIVDEMPATAVGFLDARECHCRFVVGKGGDGLALFCGANVKRGSWCGEHLSLVFEAAPA